MPDAPPAPARNAFSIKSTSDPKKVASAITKSVLESKHYPKLRAVGHGAVGQAVKAMAIATGYLRPQRIALAFTVAFETVPDARKGDGAEMSLMVFTTFDSTGHG